jgi:beta-glucosidase
MPADAEAALDGLQRAVEDGRISRERLQASLERRQQALAQCQSDREPHDATLNTLLADLAQLVTPQERQLAAELLELSLELSGNGPLPQGPGVNLIRLDSQLNSPQLPARAPALLRPSAAGFQSRLIDGLSPSPWSGDPQAPLALERLGEGPVLLQLFVRGNPFRGSAGGEEPWPAVVQQLLAAQRLAGLAVYGSPYLWQALRPLLPPPLPAAYSPGQMPEAQAVLLQRLGLSASALEGGFTD